MNQTDSASDIAYEVDLLNLGITGAGALVTLGILVAIIIFSYRYHASRKGVSAQNLHNLKIELTWITITFLTFMGFFYWGSWVYKKQVSPGGPPDYHIFVYAKQWMWKFHHQNGFVEINDLHLPLNKNIRFVMTSSDVIHSLFLPDFRVKQDILPGIYTFMNVRPKRSGSYPLFCAEYCGTDHAVMSGKVSVVNEEEYKKIVGLGSGSKLLDRGRALFQEMGCAACHGDGAQGTSDGPTLIGLRDDNYIRTSILYPQRLVRKQYPAPMPSFEGQLSDEDMRALIEYVKAMRK